LTVVVQLWYISFMIFNKTIRFRATERDWEYLRKRVIRNDTTLSHVMRKIVRKSIKEVEEKNNSSYVV